MDTINEQVAQLTRDKINAHVAQLDRNYRVHKHSNQCELQARRAEADAEYDLRLAKGRKHISEANMAAEITAAEIELVEADRKLLAVQSQCELEKKVISVANDAVAALTEAAMTSAVTATEAEAESIKLMSSATAQLINATTHVQDELCRVIAQPDTCEVSGRFLAVICNYRRLGLAAG